MRNANSYQGENERQWKEQSERKTYNMSFTKLVTRKCHVVLMKKQRRRNVQKSVLHVQSSFFFRRCRRSAVHDYILICLSKL